MSWNHRVVKKRYNDEIYFGIHEVYYGELGTGWTENAVAPVGETVEELKSTLERMLKALDKPVIEDVQ